jgi:uncharacterized protein YndB with AHSA1/START domain
MATVEVTRRMAADPSRVYALIADVTRMDQWSPEAAGARWTRGEPGTVGARFRGRNRNGVLRWSTDCTVTAVEPGHRFAFAVTWLGMPISSWEFRLTARDGGCEVQEFTTDRRSMLLRIITPLGTGVARRAEHNRRTMEATLQALDRATNGPPA